MQEKLAKARATAKILENVELGEEKELQEEILRNRQQSLYSTQIKKGILKYHAVNKIVIT